MVTQERIEENLLNLVGPPSDSESGTSSQAVQTNNYKWSSCKTIALTIAAISVCLNVGLVTCTVVLKTKCFEQLLHGPACPDNWIGYEGKCYYFSKEKRNWNSSQRFCLSHNASLLTFSASEEKVFVMRLKAKDIFWIGLKRDPGQPWKWTNGQNSTLEVMGDGGDCGFLNDESTAISSRCRMELLWICSKSDIFKCSNGICSSKK
ncbi:C-type lectin domain family 2 member D-like [Elgaria multicarinata webbii]|uniref:C-type lectin domain family 2 member D-like n=1 Tax=Elgaria multicarinata webbii TaxID=159646 RepID=UPI002FCD3645